MKARLIKFLLWVVVGAFAPVVAQGELGTSGVTIPLKGNSYVTHAGGATALNHQGDWAEWNSPEAVVSTYMKVTSLTPFRLLMCPGSVPSGVTLKVSVGGKCHTVRLSPSDSEREVVVGTIRPSQLGYLRIDLQGVGVVNARFPFVQSWRIVYPRGKESEVVFVREIPEKFTAGWSYWGRRGPSVHMGYKLPEGDTEFFYNEVTVEEGNDRIGSYFMVNGFGEGYCGIQVNSPTERRILFSVWSPFVTDDPKSIPLNDRIVCLRRGDDVHIGEFGNEGSGGQSYLKYPWKSGETYRFLTRIRPNGDNSTTYTAFFFDPERGEWRLIASFWRPKTDTWYRRPHSFLENFIPSEGWLEREVKFGNQWAFTNGRWVELTQGTFTCDATARAGVRQDYAGGVAADGRFFLRSFGFFSPFVPGGTHFERTSTGRVPNVDFEALKIK